MGRSEDDEEKLLQSAALRNANSILRARQRAEQQLFEAQNELRATAARLQLALSAGRLGDWSWEVATDVVTLGNGAAEIFGLGPQKEISLASVRDLLRREDRKPVWMAARRALAKRQDCNIEFRVHRPNGEVRWISAHGLGTYLEAGLIGGMTGVVQDITERKNAADALRRSQARLQMAVEAGQMGDWEWIISTGEVHWSTALENVHGMTAGSFGGEFEDFQRDIHPEDRERVLANIKRCLDGRSDYRVEYRIIKPDGMISWIEARGMLILDARGRPERLAGICIDVSQRKQTEEALREETSTLDLLYKTGTLLLSNLESHAIAQVVSDAAKAHSGATLGAFVFNNADDSGGTPYAQSGAQRNQRETFGQFLATELFAPTLNAGEAVRCDDVFKTSPYGAPLRHHQLAEGATPIRSYLAAPVVSRTGEVIGGLFLGHPDPAVFTEHTERAITGVVAQAAISIDNVRLYESAQKAAADRLKLLESERAARSQAERLSEMKDEFLATLSHELRTPLSAILGWSKILRGRPASDPDTLRGLETIERNARIQTRLIEDLLDMSRISSGKIRMDVQPVEPVGLIEAAIETLRPAADAKGIRMEAVLDSTAGPISGDPGRLQQVVWNLLSNSIKFTPKEGKVQVVLERVNSHIEISVTDTGIGIKPEFLPRVFERFRQEDSSLTRNYGGLGLGLSIVKSLVELHGGTVHAQSEGKDRGATFTMHFPVLVVHARMVDESRAQSKAAGMAWADIKQIDLSGIKIVVVDDESDARELITRILAERGAEVLTASNATEALQLVEQEKPQVLVSDIGMPDIDGFELLRRVRALERLGGARLPAIALTAFARSEDRTRALLAGFSVHVSKPVEPAELIATVATVAGRTGTPRSDDAATFTGATPR